MQRPEGSYQAQFSEKSPEMIAYEQEQLRKDREKAKKILDTLLEKALAGMVTKVTTGPKG